MEASVNNESKKAVYLQSLGAAQTVTGSKHLLKTPDMTIMIDCGLFQGIKALRQKNWETLPINPTDIDAMILTHAHLDHCGYIPLLVKNGYRGKIYASKPTRDLAELILRDSAHLQEEDAEKANKHGYSKHSPAKPLYTVHDVEAALPLFEITEINKQQRLGPNISFQLYTAGHIPGACSVEVLCYGKTIVFSGDIGRYHSEILPAPQHPAKADFIIMESTYGDRLHKKTDSGQQLANIINQTVLNGGNVLIPCFAVGRAQDIIHILYRLKKQNSIPSQIPVYLDSPMAASASKTLLKYPEWVTISRQELEQMFDGIIINQDYEGTQQIIHSKGPKIILAASGMLTGGRVLEYLKHYIGNAKNTVLIIGYQAEGTRGRALLNNTHEIKIHGHYFEVEANVAEIDDLSAHADQGELITWLREFELNSQTMYLVHGEPCAQDALRVKIKTLLNMNVYIAVQDVTEHLFDI